MNLRKNTTSGEQKHRKSEDKPIVETCQLWEVWYISILVAVCIIVLVLLLLDAYLNPRNQLEQTADLILTVGGLVVFIFEGVSMILAKIFVTRELEREYERYRRDVEELKSSNERQQQDMQKTIDSLSTKVSKLEKERGGHDSSE